MDELKLIFASNLIRLRTAAGMTQAELGEQLNYSDKSISKWERGEAIPDAAVLKRMSEIFGVTVDYLLNEHDAGITYLVLNSVFFGGRGNLYVVLGLVASIFAVGYLVLLRFGMNFWQLFLIVIPAEAVVYFSFHIRAKH